MDRLTFLLLLILALSLSSCQAPIEPPPVNAEIVFETSPRTSLYFAQLDGSQGQKRELDEFFSHPIWSTDGKMLFGLTWDIYYIPIFWDLERGITKECDRDLFTNIVHIQGAGNPGNPYEVVIGGVWEVQIYDMQKCVLRKTLANYGNHPEAGYIYGFSYSPILKKLIFAYGDNQIFQIVDADTYQITTIPGKGIFPTWSPDGSKIAFIGGDGLYVMDMTDFNPRKLFDHKFYQFQKYSNSPFNITIPQWSPDGRWIIYHLCPSGETCTRENSRIFRVLAEGGKPEVLFDSGLYPNWRP